MLNNRKGFTLIELLIVVVIIGILAAIAIPKFGSAREKAYFSAMKQDLRNLASQQEIYYSNNYSYTSSVTALGFNASEAVNLGTIDAEQSGFSVSSTHKALAATRGCAIWIGDATPAPSTPGGTAIATTQKGAPVCDP
ncbi:MAG: prepilin-type N-terminal cleavage/methylation domain-containing protein [Gemmatimonadetes bacterium]|nr:prepilin-type N-terminal cleavage/methylation domain-containing protein [Gemmatimonadota bacterium]